MNDLLHSFPGQQINEPVYVFSRPYPAAFLYETLGFLVVIIFSFLAQYVLQINTLSLSLATINSGILILGVFQLLALTVFFVAVLDFYFDIVIVTDRRLVDIDQEQLFYRRISELALEDVEDVTSIIQGFLPTIFNYGDILIQTAGAEENFRMLNVRYPREISAIVRDLSDQAKRHIPEEQRLPQTEILGVVNNESISDIATLQKVGAILPADFRLINRN